MHAHTCTHACPRAHTQTHMHTRAPTHAHIHAHMQHMCTHICTHAHKCANMLAISPAARLHLCMAHDCTCARTQARLIEHMLQTTLWTTGTSVACKSGPFTAVYAADWIDDRLCGDIRGMFGLLELKVAVHLHPLAHTFAHTFARMLAHMRTCTHVVRMHARTCARPHTSVAGMASRR